jgi:hypothetical protein
MIMPRGISKASIIKLRVTNRLLKRKVKYLTKRLEMLEGRLYQKNGASIKYVRTSKDKALAKSHHKVFKQPHSKTK